MTFPSQLTPDAIVSDACVSYSTIEELNAKILPTLQSLTHGSDFFSYYRLNLYNKQCPFWSDENGMCGNIACAVYTLDSEEDIPPIWRAEELSKLEGPKAKHPGKKLQQERPKEKPLQGMLGESVGESCVVEYDDECDERDYCIPDDEGATGKGDYVSLVDNPERFTGYGGAGAQQVWDAIYRENCFYKPLEEIVALPEGTGHDGLDAAEGLRNSLHEKNAIGEELTRDDECLEKRIFHRVLSGMHASISMHLCWDYLNQSTGEWGPNIECYKERLHNHPERISNIYFNYALLARALSKLQNYFQEYTFCTVDPTQNVQTKSQVMSLVDSVAAWPQIFDESIMFQDPNLPTIKEDIRNRFRNVSRLMDCVGCDKCRLWGKVQTAGYGTALKVLFEFDENAPADENPPLRRTELVALVNTMGRLSHSVRAGQEFHAAVEAQAKKAAKAKQNPVVGIYDDDDDEHYRGGPVSFMDEFWDEFNLVYNTWIWVLKSWVGFPKRM